MKMIRAKRMSEETRALWVQGNERNETVLDRLGTKVRAMPLESFDQICPDIARAKLHVCDVKEPGLGRILICLQMQTSWACP